MAWVLVVDDDAGTRDVLTDALGDEGYQVRTASSGQEALRVLQQEGHPSLILLDMRMPVMDGTAFLEAYRRLPGPHAPVVALTAAGRPAIDDVHGVDGVLAKPFALDDLLAVVERYLGGGRGA